MSKLHSIDFSPTNYNLEIKWSINEESTVANKPHVIFINVEGKFGRDIWVIKRYNQISSYKGDNIDAELWGINQANRFGIYVPKLVYPEKVLVSFNGVTEHVILMKRFHGWRISETYLKEASSIIYKMIYQAGILHGDTDSTNFIVVDNRVMVCDFASSRPIMKGENLDELYQKSVNYLKWQLKAREWEDD